MSMFSEASYTIKVIIMKASKENVLPFTEIHEGLDETNLDNSQSELLEIIPLVIVLNPKNVKRNCYKIAKKVSHFLFFFICYPLLDI